MKIYKTATFVLCSLMFYCCSAPDTYFDNIMKGLSNNGNNKNMPYVTAGDRTYIVGSMDGFFPDMGFHVKDEMGGLWLHPIKLADGYWAKLNDGNEQWISNADEFICYPHANEFIYKLNDLEVRRFQYCPDGNSGIVVKYSIKNNTDKEKNISFTFAVKTELSPVWASDLINVYDAPDTAYWDKDRNMVLANDVKNPWFATVSGSAKNAEPIFTDLTLPENNIGNGTVFGINNKLHIAPNKTVEIEYVIAGSYKSLDEAISANNSIFARKDELLAEKVNFYKSLVNTAKIDIPDKRLEETYNWVKFNTQWLVRNIPETGIGLGAGMPDYPWWFGCDNAYGIQAAVTGSCHEISKSTLRLLSKLSETDSENSGQIIHEVTTAGVVYNAGNTQETGQYITAVWKVYEWTGDKEFIAELYPYIKQGIHWLTDVMDTDGNLLPEGYGLAEVPGLDKEMIDVAVYTQTGLDCASKIANELGDKANAQKYADLALKLKNKINNEFWNEQTEGYNQFFATKAEALNVIEMSIKDAEDVSGYNPYKEDSEHMVRNLKELKAEYLTKPDKKQAWSLSRDYRSVDPVENGIAHEDKALRTLKYMKAGDGNGVMSIGSGINAIAQARYGIIDEAMKYVNEIVNAFGAATPGTIYEIMPNRGCFTQEWTNYGINIPLIGYVFGIKPKAYCNTVNIEPQIPHGWKNMSISSLKIGNTLLSMSRNDKSGKICYNFDMSENGWTVNLMLPASDNQTVKVNGKSVTPQTANEKISILLSGKKNKVEISMNNI